MYMQLLHVHFLCHSTYVSPTFTYSPPLLPISTLLADITRLGITDLEKLNLVKLGNGGLVLGLSQILLLPKLPQKMRLDSNVVESDTKIIVSLF